MITTSTMAEDDNSCASCLKKFDSYQIKNILGCSVCDHYYHVECTKVRTSEKLKYIQKSQWKCDKCKPSDEVTTPPIDASTDKHMKLMFQKQIKFQEDIMQQNKEILSQINKIDNLEKSIQEYKTSLEFFSTKMDDFHKFSGQITKTLKENSKDIRILKDESSEMKKYMLRLEEKIETLEQRARNTNVEITQVPETANEDIISIAVTVGEKLGIENPRQNIAAAHRLFSTRTPKPIIVELTSKATRDNWVSKFKQIKTLKASDIHNHFPRHNIYVNENLTSQNKQLLFHTKTFAKNQKYNFVWIKDGKIFIRKEEKAKIIKIRSINDLEKLKETSQQKD